jgi:hypothetical protein
VFLNRTSDYILEATEELQSCDQRGDIIRDLEFVYTGIINPFKLTEKLGVRMNDVFAELEIACVAQGDSIFSTFPSKRKKNKDENTVFDENKSTEGESATIVADEVTPELLGFDKDTLNIYRKIPTGEECNIESLVSDEYSLPKIMKALLKLEMGHFVVMLPGEKVRRKLK